MVWFLLSRSLYFNNNNDMIRAVRATKTAVRCYNNNPNNSYFVDKTTKIQRD